MRARNSSANSEVVSCTNGRCAARWLVSTFACSFRATPLRCSRAGAVAGLSAAFAAASGGGSGAGDGL